MSHEKSTPERLALFSDAVFAVVITIMVLELKPPAEPTLRALLPLWPTALSYAVSYLFIAIIWVNHHHLLRFTQSATPYLIWCNFGHLFMVSLVPAATAWMADTRFAAGPVFVYALVFVLVEIAFIAFERETLSQASDNDIPPPLRRMAKNRSHLALGMFGVAAVISFWSPRAAFSLVCCVLFIYFSPRIPELLHKPAR